MAEHGDNAQTLKDFQDTINMTVPEIEQWLGTDYSKEVGQTQEGESGSTGHQPGRHIVEMLRHQANYSTGDYAQMRRVVSYVQRHLAERPYEDITETRWRYSLMNWGHDPAKK